MGDLTRNFSRREFACRCGQCGGRAEMVQLFVNRLQLAREISNVPYTPTSGFRCELHPETVKRPTSSHPKGLAVDISTPTPGQRYRVLAGLYGAGLTRIGIGKDFVHVDDDPDKDHGLMWDYYE